MEKRKTLNKENLIDILSRKTNYSKVDAEKFINSFLNILNEEKKEADINLSGFFKLVQKDEKERQTYSVKDKKMITIPARTIYKLKIGSKLKSND